MSEWLDLPAWTRHHINDRQMALPPVKQWRHLLWYSGLPGTTRAAARALADWAENHKCTDRVYITIAELAAGSGHHRTAIMRAIVRLEETGWLEVVRHPGGRRHANDYYFTVPDFEQCPCGCEPR